MYFRSGVLVPILMGACILSGCSNNVAGTTPVPIGQAQWGVTAGSSASAEALQALRFYPQNISVNAGDTVQWGFPSGEPHTVTLLGPRTTLPPPDDPTNAAPAGPTSYDGTAYVSSGFLLLGQNYRMTFTKPGTYTYHCLIHPGMTGEITVQAPGSQHPANQAAYLAQADAQIKSDLAAAASSVASFPYATGGPHLVAGMSPGLAIGPLSPLTVLRFLAGPSLSDTSVTIAAGQTLTWTNQSNNEPHTVTIAPVGTAFPTLNPFGPATGGNIYDGTTLVNSGVLLPGQSFSLQFTKPGTYTYHCIFHDDTEHMIGTVIVT
jgi:plastocyanin